MKLILEDYWPSVRLPAICKISTGKWDANHSTKKGKYRFYTCAYEHSYSDTKRYSGECIILPGNGANVGEVFFFEGEFDAYQRTYVINDIKIIAKFLFYHLKLYWKKGTDTKQYGSATNYIRIGNFNEYTLPLPPLPEQHRIVAKIEELFSELDKGIANLKKTKAQLSQYKKSFIREKCNITMIDHNFGSVDTKDGWDEVHLGDVIDCLDNQRKPVNRKERQKRKGDIPYYGANGIVDTIDDFIFNEDLILIVEDETFTGRQKPFCYKISGKTWVNNHAHVVKPNDTHKLNLDYLNYSLWYYPFTPITTGTTGRKKLTKRALMDAQYTYPPIDLQHNIVQEIESRLSVADKLEETIDQSLKQSEALRQAVLKTAFEGKLVSQDPNDEPAEVLLERIKIK